MLVLTVCMLPRPVCVPPADSRRTQAHPSVDSHILQCDPWGARGKEAAIFATSMREPTPQIFSTQQHLCSPPFAPQPPFLLLPRSSSSNGGGGILITSSLLSRPFFFLDLQGPCFGRPAFPSPGWARPQRRGRKGRRQRHRQRPKAAHSGPLSHAAEEAGASWTNCARAGGAEREERRRTIAVPRRPRCRSRRHRCFDLFSTDVLSLARVPARVLMCFSACEQPVTTVQHGLSYSEGLVSNAGLAAFVVVLFFPSFVVRPHTRARRTWHATHSKACGHSPVKNNPVRFFSLLLAPSCSQSPAPRQA